jgi:hypothetical protein
VTAAKENQGIIFVWRFIKMICFKSKEKLAHENEELKCELAKYKRKYREKKTDNSQLINRVRDIEHFFRNHTYGHMHQSVEDIMFEFKRLKQENKNLRRECGNLECERDKLNCIVKETKGIDTGKENKRLKEEIKSLVDLLTGANNSLERLRDFGVGLETYSYDDNVIKIGRRIQDLGPTHYTLKLIAKKLKGDC